jgi:ribosome-binding protein aMBF1 (putative translation factor)
LPDFALLFVNPRREDIVPERSANAKGASVGATSPIVTKAKDAVDAVSRVTDQVQERATEVVQTVRAKTGDAQATIADKLESGAQTIRHRVRGKRRTGIVRAPRVRDTGEAVAERLDRSAYWLREHDVTDLGDLVRYQLERHPGRMALIALALGLLVGRASKRST